MTATADDTLASAADAKLALAGDGKSTLTRDERLALIRVNLAEFLNPEIIEKVLDEGRDPRIYWGKDRHLGPLLHANDNANHWPLQERLQLVGHHQSSTRRTS